LKAVTDTVIPAAAIGPEQPAARDPGIQAPLRVYIYTYSPLGAASLTSCELHGAQASGNADCGPTACAPAY